MPAVATISMIEATIIENEWLLVTVLIFLALVPAAIVMSVSKRRMKRTGVNPAEVEFNYLSRQAQRS